MGSRERGALAVQRRPQRPGREPHEHRWSGVAFFLEDDHPWFRMRCACGAERTIRAWERYSDPAPERADEPDRTTSPRPAPDG